MKEFGEKIPASKKDAIIKSLEDLKIAHKNKDIQGIDKAMASLNSMWQSASEDMYKNAQSGQPNEGSQPGPQPGSEQKQQSGNDEVTDVDFEEVKDK
jgi:molecular chaperone DnaK